MSYAFKLKNGSRVVFDPQSATLAITTPHGDVQNSTLARAEARLLELLLVEPGLTKTRDEIIEYTWQDRIVASGSLNQAVFSLRNILDDSRDHEILMTIPRRGYSFNRDYVIDDPIDSPPLNPPDQPAAHSAQKSHSTRDADLPTPLAKLKNLSIAAKGLLAGYAITLLLCAFTFSRFDFWFDTPTIEISSTKHNKITLHAISNSAAEALSLRDHAARQAQTLPAQLSGEVWISHVKSDYSVSCVRPDLSTANLQADSHQKDLASMIRQCLEAVI